MAASNSGNNPVEQASSQTMQQASSQTLQTSSQTNVYLAGPAPRGIKRKQLELPDEAAEVYREQLESIVDFAEVYRKAERYIKAEQPGRVPLSAIGVHPANLGVQGVITRHIHQNILPDICGNMTMLKRYAPVRLAKIPEDKLASWREENERMCRSDPLMPKFAPEMHLGLLTKKHFTLAHKLISDGGRS